MSRYDFDTEFELSGSKIDSNPAKRKVANLLTIVSCCLVAINAAEIVHRLFVLHFSMSLCRCREAQQLSRAQLCFYTYFNEQILLKH